MEKSGAPLSKIEFRLGNGQATSLSAYAGKVVLIVNVASKCGLTPQYDALEKTFEKYRERGFLVLAFPANEFAGQEPGTNEEIQAFCQGSFGVQFPVAEKIKVKGEGLHSLYAHLTSSFPAATRKPDSMLEKKLGERGLLTGKPEEIKWNFEKFLLNRKGEIVARFAPDFAPDDPAIISAIEKELAH